MARASCRSRSCSSGAAIPRATPSSGCRRRRILFSGDLVEYRGDAVHRRRLPRRLAGDARCDRRAQAGEARAGPRRRRCRHRTQVDGRSRRHARVRHRDVRRGEARRAARARTLRTVYKETYAALKPKFGDWVIFDHCLPFDVTRAYDEATQLPRSAHLDGAARQGDVGVARRLERSTARRVEDLHAPGLRVCPRPPSSSGNDATLAGGRRRCRSGGPRPRRSISRSAAFQCCCSTRTTRVSVGFARDLLRRSATLEILDRLGCGRAARAKGRRLEASAGFSFATS